MTLHCLSANHGQGFDLRLEVMLPGNNLIVHNNLDLTEGYPLRGSQLSQEEGEVALEEEEAKRQGWRLVEAPFRGEGVSQVTKVNQH